MKGQNLDTAPRRKPFGRPRDAEVHEAILAAALDLFIEEGLDRLTFEKVAAHAGTTRAAIYRRWDSKVAMVVEAIGQLREQSEASIGPQDRLTLEDVVRWLIATVPAVLVEDRTTRLLARLIGTVPDHPELVRTYREVYLDPRRRRFNQILEDARSRGVLPADADVEILQDMFASAMLSRLYMSDASDDQTTRDWMTRLLRQLGWLGPRHL